MAFSVRAFLVACFAPTDEAPPPAMFQWAEDVLTNVFNKMPHVWITRRLHDVCEKMLLLCVRKELVAQLVPANVFEWAQLFASMDDDLEAPLRKPSTKMFE